MLKYTARAVLLVFINFVSISANSFSFRFIRNQCVDNHANFISDNRDIKDEAGGQ